MSETTITREARLELRKKLAGYEGYQIAVTETGWIESEKALIQFGNCLYLTPGAIEVYAPDESYDECARLRRLLLTTPERWTKYICTLCDMAILGDRYGKIEYPSRTSGMFGLWDVEFMLDAEPLTQCLALVAVMEAENGND